MADTQTPSPVGERFYDWLVRQVGACEVRSRNDNTKKSRDYHANAYILLCGIMAEYKRREAANLLDQHARREQALRAALELAKPYVTNHMELQRINDLMEQADVADLGSL